MPAPAPVRGRHGAPRTRRLPVPGVLLPVVLLTAGVTAFAGLTMASAAPPAAAPEVAVDLAAASTPLAAATRPVADLLLGSPPPLPGPQRPVADVLLGSPPPTPEELERASRAERAASSVRPVAGAVTSSFGPRWGRQHKGIDFGAPSGTPVLAVTGGTVVSASYDGGYGQLVTVEHDDGTVTAYAHLSAMLVSAGATVGPGEVLGRVGSTGNSTGPHLHLEVRVGGTAVDPRPWLAARGVGL